MASSATKGPTGSPARPPPTPAPPWSSTSATRASIMIATEAGAEGINLQFCSLVINYDLPWNPQRIEQRIGRCHRYGQKHDVVVVNFLNARTRRTSASSAAVAEVPAVRRRLRRQRRSAGRHRVRRGFREAHRRHLPELPRARRDHASFEQLQRDLSDEIDDAMVNARQILLENLTKKFRKAAHPGRRQPKDAQPLRADVDGLN